jgi:putative tryptophan/tyrosine transport system substrate-binding protein
MAIQIRRRELIAALGGSAVAWPLAVRAQQPMPVIGLLSARSPVTDAPLIAVMQHGLNDTGFVEGQNIAIDYRWADGHYDRLPALAADLVQRRVACIITIGGDVSAVAAKAATSTLPIVFLIAGDPVRSGIVTSLNHPGGNITGQSALQVELETKNLELLRELRPNAATVAVLFNPNFPGAEGRVNDFQAAARSLGCDIAVLKASTSGDIETAFAKLLQARADALLIAIDPLFFNRAAQIVVLASRHAIPTLYPRREFAVAGGLMSYGSNADEGYRAAGVYAGRILKGEKPGDLPVQLPTRYQLVINLATARALGIDVPATLLARADEVIE